jgi:SAM-dependent methyltransferase
MVHDVRRRWFMPRRLTSRNDAYGREIWAFWKGGSAIEIVERDDGYVDAAPSVERYFAPFAKWPRNQRAAMRHVRGGRVLDVGCGAGRVALHLQQTGCRVTAIDSSPLAVTLCRKRGVEDARVLPFEEIKRLPRNTFDAVVMFGNNFGLFGSRAGATKRLAELHRITTGGATLVAESLDPYKTDNAAHLAYQRRNRQRGRMSGQIRVRIRFQGYVGRWFDYLFVSPSEMEAILDGTGWKTTRLLHGRGPSYIAVINRLD